MTLFSAVAAGRKPIIQPTTAIELQNKYIGEAFCIARYSVYRTIENVTVNILLLCNNAHNFNRMKAPEHE